MRVLFLLITFIFSSQAFANEDSKLACQKTLEEQIAISPEALQNVKNEIRGILENAAESNPRIRIQNIVRSGRISMGLNESNDNPFLDEKLSKLSTHSKSAQELRADLEALDTYVAQTNDNYSLLNPDTRSAKIRSYLNYLPRFIRTPVEELTKLTSAMPTIEQTIRSMQNTFNEKLAKLAEDAASLETMKINKLQKIQILEVEIKLLEEARNDFQTLIETIDPQDPKYELAQNVDTNIAQEILNRTEKIDRLRKDSQSITNIIANGEHVVVQVKRDFEVGMETFTTNLAVAVVQSKQEQLMNASDQFRGTTEKMVIRNAEGIRDVAKRLAERSSTTVISPTTRSNERKLLNEARTIQEQSQQKRRAAINAELAALRAEMEEDNKALPSETDSKLKLK